MRAFSQDIKSMQITRINDVHVCLIPDYRVIKNGEYHRISCIKY